MVEPSEPFQVGARERHVYGVSDLIPPGKVGLQLLEKRQAFAPLLAAAHHLPDQRHDDGHLKQRHADGTAVQATHLLQHVGAQLRERAGTERDAEVHIRQHLHGRVPEEALAVHLL